MCWIGFFANVDDWAGLAWLMAIWLSCVLWVPMAVVGSVRGGRARNRGQLAMGIITTIVCLPGLVMSVMIAGMTLI